MHALLMSYKALSTMLVGVGVKLTLYDPIKDPDTAKGAEYRWFFGGSLAFSIGLRHGMGSQTRVSFPTLPSPPLPSLSCSSCSPLLPPL